MTLSGVITVPSKRSVHACKALLQKILSDQHIRLFSIIDHAANVREAGMSLRPSVVFIFGLPAAGASFMQAWPTAALDLPLRLLLWEDALGQPQISYHDIFTFAREHGFDPHDPKADPKLKEKVSALDCLMKNLVLRLSDGV